MADTAYPVKLSIDYPDRPLSRLTSFFRLFVAIPILIILGALPGMYYYSRSCRHHEYCQMGYTAFVFVPLVLMIQLGGRRPRL
ncbi:MAG TPA: hypothetical protein DCZ43_06275, partial [candidate division Zixibacteria bacterium]|nr:hypothetical protein [candidate division Zixibacteria bacterium]